MGGVDTVDEFKRIYVSFTTKKISVGASNPVSAALSEGHDIETTGFGSTGFRELVEAYSSQISRARDQHVRRIDMPMNFDLELNARGGSSYKVKYLAYGSSVKGLLRASFDSFFIKQAIENRIVSGKIDPADLAKKLKENVGDRFLKEIAGNIWHYKRELFNASSIAAWYAVLLSPYTCLSTIAGLECMLPIDPNYLRFKKVVNKILGENISRAGELCVDGDCVPLGRPCVSCTVFGANGLSSMVRVGNFTSNISPKDRDSRDVFEPRLRVLTGEGKVRPYWLQYLVGEGIVFRGHIDIVPPSNPSRIAFIARSPYLPGFLNYLESELGIKGLPEQLSECAKGMLHSGDLKKKRDCIASIAELAVCLSLSWLDKGGLTLGRRGSLGYGRISVDLRDACWGLWDELRGKLK